MIFVWHETKGDRHKPGLSPSGLIEAIPLHRFFQDDLLTPTGSTIASIAIIRMRCGRVTTGGWEPRSDIRDYQPAAWAQIVLPKNPRNQLLLCQQSRTCPVGAAMASVTGARQILV
jgi:hypothetical protein